MTENERLKIIREELGFTQANFAASIGIKQGSYSDIERGEVGVSGVVLKELIKKYRVNPTWLYEGSGSKLLNDPETSEKATGKNKSSVCKECKKHEKTIEAHLKTIEIQQEYIASLKAALEGNKAE